MTCAAPDARKPLVILRRQSTKATGTFVYTKTNLRTNPGLWRTILTKTAAGFSENPDSTDNLVRDIEESGYPVDGANEQFVPPSDSLTVESDRSGSPPTQPDCAPKTSITPTEKP
jgi:hypothetical protein